MKRELDIPLEENAGKDEMESWKMRMEAGQDKRRMLWRNQELWLLGGGVLALLVCILVPHIWISALVLAGWLGISAIFVWKIYPSPSGGARAAGAYPETDAGAYEKRDPGRAGAFRKT